MPSPLLQKCLLNHGILTRSQNCYLFRNSYTLRMTYTWFNSFFLTDISAFHSRLNPHLHFLAHMHQLHSTKSGKLIQIYYLLPLPLYFTNTQMIYFSYLIHSSSLSCIPLIFRTASQQVCLGIFIFPAYL